jgi:predicted Zn-dependent protease with MMP-like domain
MDRESFAALVAKAVSNLPPDFLAEMDNVDVIVSDLPTPRQVRKARLGRGSTLLGLYEGVPLTQRGAGYQLVLPDKITIFRLPIEESCADETQIPVEIERVLRHEVAHYFGISDERLREMGRY